MAHRRHHDLVDEQADHNRGRAEQYVVDEAHDHAELGVSAILGHVGAGQDTDRRADDDRQDGDHDRADDGVQQAAGRAWRRRVLGEDRQREPAHSLENQRAEDQDQPAQAEGRGGESERPCDRVAHAAADVKGGVRAVGHCQPARC